MAFLNICGFETGDLTEANYSTGGAVSVQSSIKRTGAYALRMNPTASAPGVHFKKHSATGVMGTNFGLTTAYVTLYFRYATIDGGGLSRIGRMIDSSGNIVAYFAVSAGGAITMVGTTTSATIATISTGVWYQLDATFVSNGTCSASIDEGTPQTCTGGNFNSDELCLGNDLTNRTDDCYWDDLAISDSGIPGAGQVNILKPNATGSYTAWASGSYADVDEVPHDSDTTYARYTTGGWPKFSVNLDSAATGGISGSIKTVKSVAIVRDEGGASNLAIGLRYSGNTDYTSGAVGPGTTYVAWAKMHATAPGGGAWSAAVLDALECEMLASDNVPVRCTAIYAMVWCTGVPASQTGPLVGGKLINGGILRGGLVR